MTQPRSLFLPVMGHEIHVTEWGEPSAPAAVLWHGLARTGRDFDELAAGLATRYRVICPDTIGRGLSSWSAEPDRDYCLDAYGAQALALLDALGIGACAWIGTSMGGLIGMRIASGPAAHRLSALVVNDIGPEIPQPAIDRILAYAGTLPIFHHAAEAEAWMRRIYEPFGPAPEAFWERMLTVGLRRRDDGLLTLHYDPAVVRQFAAHPDDFLSWDRYLRISTPTHLVWGRHSDILTAEIVARMQGCGPRPGVRIHEDCGHAPTLSSAGDIAAVMGILRDLGA